LLGDANINPHATELIEAGDRKRRKGIKQVKLERTRDQEEEKKIEARMAVRMRKVISQAVWITTHKYVPGTRFE